MTLKVKIEPRDECISDGLCISLCPDVFDWHEDGKSMIVDKWRTNPDDPNYGEVSDDLEECVQDALNACPVQIIHMEKA